MKTRPIQMSFTGGEWSPRLHNRADLAKYWTAVELLENFIILPQGGVTRRPGWHFVAEVADSTKFTRLLPFVFSTVQAYAIEGGEYYLRFYMDHGRITVTMATETDFNPAAAYAIGPHAKIGPYLDLDCGTSKHLYVAAPQGQATATALSVEVQINGADTLTVTNEVANVITIRLANTTPAKNAANLIQVALRALVSVSSISVAAWTVTENAAYAAARPTAGVTIAHAPLAGGEKIFQCDTAIEASAANTSFFPGIDVAYWTEVTAGDPCEVTTTYTADETPRIDHKQSADMMWLVHGSHNPANLNRTGHTSWNMSDIDFNVVDAALENDFNPAGSYAVEAHTKIGPYILLNCGSGKYLYVCAIHNETGATTVNVAAEIAADDVLAITAVGNTITISLANTTPANNAANLIQTALRALGTVNGISVAAWTVTENVAYAADRPIAGVALAAAALAGGNKVFQCVAAITGVGTNTSYFPGTDPTYWTSVTAPDWSDAKGWPQACSFHEQRFVYGGSASYPQMIWPSRSGSFNDFSVSSPTVDDDACYFYLPADQLDGIYWLCSSKALFAGTGAGVIRIFGGESGITPTSIDSKNENFERCYPTAPLRIGNAILFVQKYARKLRELAYVFADDSFHAADLTLLAEHITEGGIQCIVYQQEPHSIVWALRGDGILLPLAYMREEELVGWGRHITDGVVESITVIPDPTGAYDELWAVIKRTVGGVEKRYVEYLDNNLMVDSGVTYSGVPTNTVTGLDHLEGKTVDIVGDGCVYPQAVVTAGAVTLDGPAASEIQVGLNYVSKLVTMKPNFQTGAGSTAGLPKKWAQVFVSLLTASGVEINGEVIPFRSVGSLIGEPIVPFTGEKAVSQLGWTDGRITIEQALPLPCTIRAIYGDMEIGG